MQMYLLLTKLMNHAKFRAIIVSVFLLVGAVCFQFGSKCFMSQRCEYVLASIDSADAIQHRIMMSCDLTRNHMGTIRQQFLIAHEIKTYYEKLSRIYYEYYYSFSVSAVFSLAILSVAIFLVTTAGWQSTTVEVKSFFLTMSVISVVFYLLPTVLDVKDNFQKNTDKVKIFQKIEMKMVAFSNISDSLSKPRIDTIIKRNYKMISDNFDVITTIDDTKVNSSLQEALNSIDAKSSQQ